MRAGLGLLLLLAFAAAVGAEGKGVPGQRETAAAGGVTVSATLLRPAAGSSTTIDFELVLTTHMGALPSNMLKVARLEEQGQVKLPIAWSGGGGGHHLSGKLSFAADRASLNGTYTLLLQGINGPNDLRFEWTIPGGV